MNVGMWKSERNGADAFSSNAYSKWTIKCSAQEAVHHVPTVQAELSAQIERGWFIQFDLRLVPHYSCYREG
jgi:hypothetical protein